MMIPKKVPMKNKTYNRLKKIHFANINLSSTKKMKNLWNLFANFSRELRKFIVFLYSKKLSLAKLHFLNLRMSSEEKKNCSLKSYKMCSAH